MQATIILTQFDQNLAGIQVVHHFKISSAIVTINGGHFLLPPFHLISLHAYKSESRGSVLTKPSLKNSESLKLTSKD